MSTIFEEKEIEIGDVVVQLKGGCENCECDNLGIVFKVMQIGPPTYSDSGKVFCKKGKAFYVTNVVYAEDGSYYVPEWLVSYKHFKNWYPEATFTIYGNYLP